jgi:hypothetical protein
MYTYIYIYMHMETTQGISSCSYLYLKLAKTPCFCNYVLWFFFYKIGEQEGGRGSALGGAEFGTGGREEEQEKG